LRLTLRRCATAVGALRAATLTASRLAALLCIGATLAFGVEAAVAGASRGALWKVVQACLISHALTGVAFPCLEVNVSGGTERGYAVLRPPFDASGLILTPTRRIAGVEDPSLAAVDAPNYFEDAWSARKFLEDTPHEPLPQDGVVLAVNSRPSRTQDQLHIHIGCLPLSTKRTLRALASALPTDRWVALARPLDGLEFSGRVLIGDDLAGVNPFRLAAEANPSLDRSQLTIVVARIAPPGGRDGFILLASFQRGRHSVEDFLLDGSAASCR
jgi:CDP-diacylglycerol pyrophosphatase